MIFFIYWGGGGGGGGYHLTFKCDHDLDLQPS